MKNYLILMLMLLISCVADDNEKNNALPNSPPLIKCNKQSIACNCENPPAQMGNIIPSNACESGQQGIFFCEEDCGPWFSWTAYCHCE